ncbi:MAG: 5'-methylthioadenosine/adenosylhomocysteine nucleosidase [Pseudanabaenaceae cyanobacterium]|jgi:adenosylhomocysteine nucleosidase
MTIAIMSAMPEENHCLVAAMAANPLCVTYGGRDYHVGKLWGHDVVIVFSRWGKVAAATSATTLITKFNAKEIIFTGVAGGVQRNLKVGDIVIGQALCQHDMDARPLFPRHEIPLLGQTKFMVAPEKQEALVAATERYLQGDFMTNITSEIREQFQITTPKMITGLIASGDKFFASQSDLDNLRADLPEAVCVEMEGAAVAQVCFEYNIPFSVVRTISDSADESAPTDFPAFVTAIASQYAHGILHQLLSYY